MNEWLRELNGRVGHTSEAILVRELDLAFTEIPDPPQPVSDMHDLLRFCRFDAIAPWLRQERDVLARAEAFARRVGANKVATILADALAGTPQPPVSFSVNLPDGVSMPIDVPTLEVTRFDGKDWGGTDLALSFSIEPFEKAVLREALALGEKIDLQPPLEVRQRQQADARVGERMSAGKGAAELFTELVSARHPTMLAGSWEQYENRVTQGCRPVALEHRPFAGASPQDLARVEKRYGPVVKELLDLYAAHDGADLFCHEGEPAFCMVPMAHWQELLDEAIGWAETVTWQFERDEIPSYLYSAIAFGYIPLDSEKWLFITEGEHAGKIMLSDTDLIEAQPRFASLGEFVATLLADTPRILNCGGYVRYLIDDENCFPVAYRPEGAEGE